MTGSHSVPNWKLVLRIVFLGTPNAAVPTLEALVRAGHDVVSVVTQPDRPAGRSRRPQPPPVKQVALAAGLQVLQPERVRTLSFRRQIEALAPDVLVVVAYGRILGPRLLATPRLGPVNLHFSLLPAYRGAAPVQWALARGEGSTGVTSMQMNERLDEGDVLLQREVPIEPDEHAPALESRLAATGAALMLETLAGLEAGTLDARPQDHERATYAPILTRADGHGDATLEARLLEGRVRGFDPWPGLWFLCRDRRMRVVAARAEEGPPLDAAPGDVIAAPDGGLFLACGAGTRLRLLRVQPEGGRPLAITDAVNGRRIAAGDRFDGPAAS